MAYQDLATLRTACESAPVEMDRWALLDLIFNSIGVGVRSDNRWLWEEPLWKLAKMVLEGQRIDLNGVPRPTIANEQVETVLQELVTAVLLPYYGLEASIKGKIMVLVHT